MPANLTPEYLEAERLYRQAKSNEEKLSALELMLSTIPKHKGTEKLQADIKRKIAKLREENEKRPTKTKKGASFYIPKEGAGQVVIVGPPNSGKSSLLSRFTKAQVEVADYPYTTRNLQPGMMPFENTKIQLIDTPAISEEFFEPWVSPVIRNADLAVILVNLSSPNLLEETETVLKKLRDRKIEFVKEKREKFSPDGMAYQRAIFLATHLDAENAEENLKIFKELYGEKLPIFSLSLTTGEGCENFSRVIFEQLEIIRVYTKTPGKPPDLEDPVTLPKGSTVYDFAFSIHKELAKNLNYARIWSKKKYQGQRVPRDYVLEDEDIVELHS